MVRFVQLTSVLELLNKGISSKLLFLHILVPTGMYIILSSFGSKIKGFIKEKSEALGCTLAKELYAPVSSKFNL